MVVLQSAAGCWGEPAMRELQRLGGLALSKVLACHWTAEELEAILGLELDWQLVTRSFVLFDRGLVAVLTSRTGYSHPQIVETHSTRELEF